MYALGWSNDCICTSSSLTTPPVPSLIIDEAIVPGRGLVAIGEALRSEPSSPPRLVAMASISSMNPIAPPSDRAARRNAAK